MRFFRSSVLSAVFLLFDEARSPAADMGCTKFRREQGDRHCDGAHDDCRMKLYVYIQCSPGLMGIEKMLVPEQILIFSVLLRLRREVAGIRTMKVTQAHIAKRFIEEGLGVSFLPRSIVRRELLEGRLMDVPFDLLPLPAVSTYFMTHEMGGIEREFLQRIQRVYFK